MSHLQKTVPPLDIGKRGLFGLIGLAFFAAGAFVLVELSLVNIMLSVKGASTDGVIERLVESELVDTADGVSESKYLAYYSFQIPNGDLIQGHTNLSGDSWASLSPGQIVRVLYMPKKPAKNRLADYQQWWVSYLIMITFPPLFGGIGICILFSALWPETYDRIGVFLHKALDKMGMKFMHSD